MHQYIFTRLFLAFVRRVWPRDYKQTRKT